MKRRQDGITFGGTIAEDALTGSLYGFTRADGFDDGIISAEASDDGKAVKLWELTMRYSTPMLR